MIAIITAGVCCALYFLIRSAARMIAEGVAALREGRSDAEGSDARKSD